MCSYRPTWYTDVPPSPSGSGVHQIGSGSSPLHTRDRSRHACIGEYRLRCLAQVDSIGSLNPQRPPCVLTWSGGSISSTMLADTQSRLDICQTWCSNSGSHLPYPLYGYKLIAVAEARLSPAQRMPYLGIQLDQSERADCGQLDSFGGTPGTYRT